MTLPAVVTAILTTAEVIEQLAFRELPELEQIEQALAKAISSRTIAPAVDAALEAGEVAADLVETEKFGPKT